MTYPTGDSPISNTAGKKPEGGGLGDALYWIVVVFLFAALLVTLLWIFRGSVQKYFEKVETALVEVPAAPGVPPASLTADTPVNLRVGPGLNYQVVGSLEKGEAIGLIGRLGSGAWLLAETDHGQRVWVTGLEKYVSVDAAVLESLPVVPVPADVPTIPVEAGAPAAAPTNDANRPATGVIGRDRRQSGCGTVDVDNGTSSDGVLVLVGPRRPAVSAYVRAGEVAHLDGIGDGTYDIVFTTGVGWDGNRFAQDARYQRFDDPLTFEGDGDTCDDWELTLHGVVGGTASTHEIGADQFPSIGP